VKGLVFSQGVCGYEPLHRDRRRRRAAAVPCRLTSTLRLAANSIGSNCCSSRSRRWRPSGTRCSPATGGGASAGGEDVARHQRRRFGIRRRALVGGAVPSLRQSPSDRLFRRASADALAKRIGRPRARRSKAGNPAREPSSSSSPVWLRHQPQSALALWFEERVRRNGGRLKKTTIVVLARKPLVALWKYVTAGVIIEGVVMKTELDPGFRTIG
jgi:transposase